ncbi:alpha-ketoacid dehydrogenase subunit beta [Baekduia sp.]|uniref:alpha-ketoacid dehydrogenase subunit beta n=1 Tax=Baekduia sp. TaxID=2600305 RepID=UPI002D78D7F3|nr:transketolase C-terminal domain-containing protein [Baekduia sp.]
MTELTQTGAAVSTMKAALTEVLGQELARSSDVLVLGETIRDGGAAGVAAGLFERFGSRQVIETPVSENAIFGAVLGLALSGFTPIVEIYSADFLLAVANEVVNDIPKWRQQQGRGGALPIVIRGCMGANGGLGPEHSQAMEPYLHHTPGLTVVTPGTPADAAGLLRSAIASPDPVVFLEHRRLYDVAGPVPTDPGHRVPLGRAELVAEGDDLTVVAWGWMRTEAVLAVEALAREDITADLIDPRTISPIDWDPILASVERTGRLLVAEETPITGSVGAEIVARVVERSSRPVQVARVAMPDAIHPYSAAMERELLPTAEDVARAARQLVTRRWEAAATKAGQETNEGGSAC